MEKRIRIRNKCVINNANIAYIYTSFISSLNRALQTTTEHVCLDIQFLNLHIYVTS